MEASILSRTAIASLAIGAAQFVAKLIDFVLILVLARLLTPEDFALIAIAMIFVQITEAIFEVPVFQVLIRNARVTRDMLYTAFTISLLRSGVVLVTIWGLTPIVAFLFDEPRLYLLMPVLAFAPAMRGLYNPKMVFFVRRLNFFPDSIIAIVTKFATALFALPFALMTESYWALVLMTVLSPAVLLIASYTYLPFKPKLSLTAWNVFANMVGWSTVSQLFGAAYWQANVFLLGQFATRRMTGNYSIASNLSGTIYHIFVIPVTRPFISSFSELDRIGSLRKGYLLATRAAFLVTGPIFVGLAMLAEPAIMLLFGKEWTDAPIFLSVLALNTLIAVAVLPSGAIAYTFDRTIYIAIKSILSFIFLVIFTVLGFIYFGLAGFLIGQLLGALVSSALGLWMVKKLIGISYIDQLRVIFIPTLSLGIMATFIHALSPYIVYDSQLTLVFSNLAIASASLLLYLSMIFAFWYVLGKPDGLEKTVLKTVRDRLKRQRGEVST